MAPLAAALQLQQQQQQQRALSGQFASCRSASSSSISSSRSAASTRPLHCRRPPSVVRASSLNGNNGHHLNGNHLNHQSPRRRRAHHADNDDGAFDLVLSSGFLAFALHTGFLKAVEESGVPVAGIMGTSAGALAGSLFAAGYSAERVAKELSAVPPIQLLRPCWEPWRGGVLSMDAVVERLRDLLPPTFEDLERDFAVGVVDSHGNHVLIDRGPLPEAVVASAAIPFVFAAVDVPHPAGDSSSRPSSALSSVDAAEQAVAAAENAERRQQAAAAARAFKDGGVVDRIGVKAWRERRRRMGGNAAAAAGPLPPCLVHVIERSSPFSGEDDAAATGEAALHVVRSPKSGVSFFDLGAFAEQYEGARGRALPVVQRAVERERLRVAAAMRVSRSAPVVVTAASSGGGGGGGGVGSLPLSVTAAAAMSQGKRAAGSTPPPVPQPQRVAPPTARPRG
jgi:predicted acylesterase/phospholipase RssA